MTRRRLRSAPGPGTGTADSRARVYGWPGAAYRIVRRADLDDLAEVHHRHPVADVLDDRQVVGDEQVGQPEPLLEVGQQVEDLGLDRHVERGDRLVADDELGLHGQRPGHPDALALTARELVRIAIDVASGRGRPAGAGQRSAPASPRPRPGVRLDRLGDDRADGHPRIERPVRVLEDDLHPAAHPAQLVRSRGSPGRRRRIGPSRSSVRAAGSWPDRSCSCRSPTRRPGRASRRGGPRRSTPSTALTVPWAVWKMPDRIGKWTLRSSTSTMLAVSCGRRSRRGGGRPSRSCDPPSGLGRPAARQVAGRLALR